MNKASDTTNKKILSIVATRLNPRKSQVAYQKLACCECVKPQPRQPGPATKFKGPVPDKTENQSKLAIISNLYSIKVPTMPVAIAEIVAPPRQRGAVGCQTEQQAVRPVHVSIGVQANQEQLRPISCMGPEHVLSKQLDESESRPSFQISEIVSLDKKMSLHQQKPHMQETQHFPPKQYSHQQEQFIITDEPEKQKQENTGLPGDSCYLNQELIRMLLLQALQLEKTVPPAVSTSLLENKPTYYNLVA